MKHSIKSIAIGAALFTFAGIGCSSDDSGPLGNVDSLIILQRAKRNDGGDIFQYTSYLPGAKIAQLSPPTADGKLSIIYLRPLDLSVDETMREILDAVERTAAKRLVIDSLAGFEMALAPSFRADFRESLYRMIGALTRTGVTIVSTVELTETFTELALSPYSISFLSDDIIRLRYVEIGGQLRKAEARIQVPYRPGLAHAVETQLRDKQNVTPAMLEGYYSQEYMVLADGPVKRVEDLKGRVIMTNAAGSAVDVAMRAMLRKFSLEDKRDYTMIETPYRLQNGTYSCSTFRDRRL